MAELTFSIVLCTRNRERLLGDALRSIAAIDYSPERFELILVDNASSDGTRELATAFAAGAPFAVRYLFETRIGLSAARNRAIAEARGEYLFFTDDDQLVDPAVLSEHERVARAHKSRVQQGAIALCFVGARPPWLRGELTTMLGTTQDVPEGPAAIDLYGGNMCLARTLFDDFAPFREDLGKGAAGYSEDIEITRRLTERGERIVYAPGARIYHVIEADRTTRAFFRRNAFEKGLSDGLVVGPGTSWLRLLQDGARALSLGIREAGAAVIDPDGHKAMVAQTRAANRAGRLLGVLRAKRSALRGHGASLDGGGGARHESPRRRPS